MLSVRIRRLSSGGRFVMVLVTQRERMVERQIVARGVRDPAVLAAMRSVVGHLCRQAFGPAAYLMRRYFHASLPHQFDEYLWIDET